MFIYAPQTKQILNADFVARFCIVQKPDAALIVASYQGQDAPVTMARYADAPEARSVLGQLLTALAGGAAYFEMPDSRLYYEEHKTKDARTKRKGGS